MPPLVLLVIVAGAAIMLGAWYFSEAQKIKRALRAAEHVPIANYPHGGIKRVIGVLSVEGDMLSAPLSGRQCAAWEVVVEEQRSSGKSTSWYTIVRQVEAVPFLVEDETGRAHVDPSGAQLVVTADRHSRSGTFDDPTPEERAFLDRHGEEATGWVFNRTLRYREGVLEPDELVAVLGQGAVSYDDAPDMQHQGGYRAPAASKRLDIRAAGGHPLYISDDASVVS